MTKQQLIDLAKIKGATITEEYEDLVGIRFKGQFVWHWFNTNYRLVSFNHSYSTNTGKSKKGLFHSFDVQKSLGYYNNEIRSRVGMDTINY